MSDQQTDTPEVPAPAHSGKTNRTVRVTYAANDGTGRVVVEIRSWTGARGKVKSDLYVIAPLPSDWGLAFTVAKVGPDNVPAPEPYHVMVDGLHSLCGCRGFISHQHCRHLEAVRALIAAKKIG